MKPLSRSARVAIAAAALGLTTLAVPAYAQPLGGGGMPQARQIEGGKAHAHRPGTGIAQHRPGGLVEALLGARDAEAADVAIVRLSHRLDLTEAQQALLDALKVDVLAAREAIDAARQAIAPVAEDEAATLDLTARYAGMVAMTSARAEALAYVQPAFDAFIATLDAQQLETLSPERPVPSGNRHGFGPARPNG